MSDREQLEDIKSGIGIIIAATVATLLLVIFGSVHSGFRFVEIMKRLDRQVVSESTDPKPTTKGQP